jgi:four helix bundle protein
MQDFTRLLVWEEAHRLVLAVYDVTRSFPPEERFGLTSRIRRCAASVPSNIAEGSGRGSDAGFARFLHMAMGSASELEYQLLLARDLAYLPAPRHAGLTEALNRIKRRLNALLTRVKQPPASSQ